MRAKNYDNVLWILILKYSSGPEKLPELSRDGPLVNENPSCFTTGNYTAEVIFT